MTETKSTAKDLAVPDEIAMNQIYYIRDQKAMPDRDLAA